MSDDVLETAAAHARRFIASLQDRPVASRASHADLLGTLGGALPDDGVDAARVVDELARAVDPGLVATAGPRFFGFVIGGRLPAALGADWLTSVWDQNAGLFATSPAASVVEEVAATWILDLLRLPPGAAVGFVTGGQMANFTALAAARYAVLARAGWDVEARGLYGGPEVQVVVSEDSHVTVFSALRYLGLGAERVSRVASDSEGRMRAAALRDTLDRLAGPTIVCAQAGDVNSGAFDPLDEIIAAAHRRGAWVHVDGAFGLWAAVSPSRRELLRGAAAADSWSVDAHKWLNVPYDSGLAIVADPHVLRGCMATQAAYLVQSAGVQRDPMDYSPEFSRRGRGFVVYAALRSLGRKGVEALVDRCCDHARHLARRVGSESGISVLNEVVLNQVLLAVEPPRGGDRAAFLQQVVRRIQEDGTCWMGGTLWHGAPALRVSFSNASTTLEDVDRAADSILRAVRG